MGEDFDPLTTDNGLKPISHSGILITMAAMIAAGSLAGFVFGGRFWGLGVMFGGVLSFANYFWLGRSTRAIFSPDAISSTGVLAAKYMLRYAALGAVLLLVYLTGALPIAAVILGLAAFAFAVVVQGLKNILASTF
jgi:hypothetical protein